MSNGVMANINQQIDFDTAAIVCEEFGYTARSLAEIEAEIKAEEEAAPSPMWETFYAHEDAADLRPRPPVATMLGHVDHGKTSLLDVIRGTDVFGGEAGGITQHVGAYQVTHNGQKITFLDTPGHEAFTAMRARGAQGADIAILVVAADDGVMPQTREAIAHARAAKVPIIVALNKMDLPSANPERAKQQLAELDLVPDEWDGDTLVVPVSAKQKEGLEDLLEALLLVADEAEIVANPDRSAQGTVIEGEIGQEPWCHSHTAGAKRHTRSWRYYRCWRKLWADTCHVRFSWQTHKNSDTFHACVGSGLVRSARGRRDL